MKRSEMVKHLGDLLPDYLTIVGFHGDRYQVAEHLLDKLMKNGMLPPPTWTPRLPKVAGNDCMLRWDDETEE
jgi:hypothetical protein